MPRWFFKRFEQGVERLLRQHVHFVDQIHLHPAARGHVLRVVDQLTDVVDAGVAGRVDLEQVDVAARIDRQAGLALAARVGGRAAFAVQRLGEDPRDGRFADAAGAGEQESVVHAASAERIGQRTHHVLLPDQFGETLRAPFAGEDEVGHRDLLESGRVGRGGAACARTDLRVIVPRPIRPTATATTRTRANQGRDWQSTCRPTCSPAPATLDSAPLKTADRPTRAAGTSGEVSEWLKEHAWKVCKRLNRASGVRIPLSPPDSNS